MEATILLLTQLSSNLVSRLASVELEEMAEYMRERDAIFIQLQQMRPTPSEAAELRPAVDRILAMDALIVARMNLLRGEAKAEMDKLANGRTAKTTYEDAYAMDQESYFFDTKR
ncbi:flagellar protein FliT [Paenibacillus daejeonensis]|uniref:flagellar protein FliT n=1 Tax=Paenibacillus daejeonensis TaxID=135193 RepID=UPI000362C84A|nr:flagellar protein FliT [Paenibacillus daejeonensis]